MSPEKGARVAIRALFFCLLAACGSAQGNRTELHAGPAMLNFGYKEFDETGAQLNSEDGDLPGLVVDLAHHVRAWRFGVQARLFSGTADHDGRTNRGRPIKTDTDERLQSISLSLAWKSQMGAWPIAPYIGLGYHRWDRDIRPTRTSTGATVSGLFEAYSWKTAELGLLATMVSSQRFGAAVDARVFRVLDPKLKVRFESGFDDATLRLGEEAGARLGIVGVYTVGDSLGVKLELYHERWAFGRSTAQPLTSDGATVGSVFEPYSETRNNGVTLGLVLSF